MLISENRRVQRMQACKIFLYPRNIHCLMLTCFLPVVYYAHIIYVAESKSYIEVQRIFINLTFYHVFFCNITISSKVYFLQHCLISVNASTFQHFLPISLRLNRSFWLLLVLMIINSVIITFMHTSLDAFITISNRFLNEK